jgi:hypothetical protein
MISFEIVMRLIIYLEADTLLPELTPKTLSTANSLSSKKTTTGAVEWRPRQIKK